MSLVQIPQQLCGVWALIRTLNGVYTEFGIDPFSILKTECIYRHKPATFSEADEMIDRYIHFYNHERIQSKTGVPPLSLRHSC